MKKLINKNWFKFSSSAVSRYSGLVGRGLAVAILSTLKSFFGGSVENSKVTPLYSANFFW